MDNKEELREEMRVADWLKVHTGYVGDKANFAETARSLTPILRQARDGISKALACCQQSEDEYRVAFRAMLKVNNILDGVWTVVDFGTSQMEEQE